MTTTDAWLWPTGLGVLGLVFGSFIATLAIRWPQGRRVSIGRSECDSCARALGAAELMPVLSYALQRGRCRGCGAGIAVSHPATELLGLAIGLTAGLIAPGIDGVAGAVFGWLLLALAAVDLRAFWLPDLLTLPLAALGLGWGIVPLADRLVGGVAGFGALWLVAWLYRRARGRDGLGGGDPKLFGAIGCWLGWQALPMVLLAASAGGLALVLALRLAGHRMTRLDRLPFGALLAPAAWLVWVAAIGWGRA